MFNNERKLTPSVEFVPQSAKLVIDNYEAIIVIVLLPALLAALGSLTVANNRVLGFVILAVATVWQAINLPSGLYLRKLAAVGKKPSIKECYVRGLPFWPKIILFEIIFSLGAIIGFILLILPGLIIFRRYYLTPYYILDKNRPIKESMQLSADQSKPVSGYVWGIIGVTLAFTLIGAFATTAPLIGPILGVLINLIFVFGAALRWQEIKKSADKKSK